MLRKINEKPREVNRVYQLKHWKWGIIDQQVYNKRIFLLIFFVFFFTQESKAKMSFKAQGHTSSLEGP